MCLAVDVDGVVVFPHVVVELWQFHLMLVPADGVSLLELALCQFVVVCGGCVFCPSVWSGFCCVGVFC